MNLGGDGEIRMDLEGVRKRTRRQIHYIYLKFSESIKIITLKLPYRTPGDGGAYL